MKRTISLGTALIFMLMTAAVTFTITAYYMMDLTNKGIQDIQQKQTLYNKLSEVDEYVRKNYIGEIDETKLVNGIIEGYIYGTGDKYASYFDEEEYDQMLKSSAGQFEGIGINVALDVETGCIKVVNVFKGSPAEKGGVKPGDLIIKVGDEAVPEIGYESALAKLKGEVGTTASFTVQRKTGTATKEIKMDIKRESFDTQSVIYEMLADNIALVRITEFNATTFTEFAAAMNELQQQGAKGIVFDVRFNPGGQLQSIVRVLDMLLPEGPIARIIYKNGNEDEVYRSDKNSIDLPMAVVINENTYSAAELFASALRDYNKATLVGKTTYGKGTVQNIIQLKDKKTAISISTSLYAPPFGENYEGIGVKPHIEVDMPDDLLNRFYELKHEEDPQLMKAIEVVKEKIASAESVATNG